MKVICVFLLLSTFSTLIVMQERRCKRLCAFVNFPNNESIDTSSCTAVSVNDSFCSVFAELDYGKNRISGRLGTEKCSNMNIPYIQTEIASRTNLTFTVRYTCAEDDCDSKFIDTYFPPKSSLNYQDWTVTDITDLLDDSASPVFKSNCTAATEKNNATFCLGRLTITTTNGSIPDPGYNFTRPNCSQLSTNDNLLSIRQSCSSPDDYITEVILRYDADNCAIKNQDMLVEKISGSLLKQLNCSTEYAESNCTQTKSAGSISTSLPSAVILLFMTFTSYSSIKYDK
jgi:hypothetical protein